jgi:hypothetical protein
MGFETSKGKIVYCNLKNGMWAIKKDGEDQLFSSYTGILTAIEWKEEEYQGQKYTKLNLTVVDGDEKVLLQIRWDSGYARGFIQAIGNCNLNERITFSPSSKVVDGKTKTTMFLNQHGKAAKWTWTKENPGELPPMASAKIKGKIVWDNTDQQEYYEKYLKTKIIPNLVNGFIAEGIKEPVSVGVEDDDPQDLPF